MKFSNRGNSRRNSTVNIHGFHHSCLWLLSPFTLYSYTSPCSYPHPQITLKDIWLRIDPQLPEGQPHPNSLRWSPASLNWQAAAERGQLGPLGHPHLPTAKRLLSNTYYTLQCVQEHQTSSSTVLRASKSDHHPWSWHFSWVSKIRDSPKNHS